MEQSKESLRMPETWKASREPRCRLCLLRVSPLLSAPWGHGCCALCWAQRWFSIPGKPKERARSWSRHSTATQPENCLISSLSFTSQWVIRASQVSKAFPPLMSFSSAFLLEEDSIHSSLGSDRANNSSHFHMRVLFPPPHLFSCIKALILIYVCSH